jgi:pyruvate dehydrogenase E2 component (dihydrolipoamide acetyltransferase)
MADVIMPKMGDSMEVGKLLSWRKRSGETVKTGDIIAEIETDKSNVEIEAEDDGVFTPTVAEGQEIPVGNVIATIGGAPAPKSKTEPVAAPAATAAEPKKSTPMPSNGQNAQPPSSDRLKASPLARKIARERNIDIAQVTGSGPFGRIVEADVEAFGQKPAAAGAASAAPASTATPVSKVAPIPSGEVSVIELSQIRRVIAKRMVESKTTIPHFYVTVEVDMGEAMSLREKLNTYEEGLAKISLNDFLLKASAKALMKFPEVNAVFRNDQIVQYPAANVGVAVALDDGLIVPVIRNANILPLRQLATVAKDLINKARAKKLQPNEYSGGTFTVSSLGGFDVDNFIAIIDPSQGAILAVSTIVKKPVVVNDEIVIRQRMNITLSGDHRVMDGATGAKFIQEIKRLLQNPLSLIE